MKIDTETLIIGSSRVMNNVSNTVYDNLCYLLMYSQCQWVIYRL